MRPSTLRTVLLARANALRGLLVHRWGEVPHRQRELDAREYPFPEDPDGIFPWAAVCLVRDGDRGLLISDADHDERWEPPGGKGRFGETPPETARREVREETGVEITVTELVATELLLFEYGTGPQLPVLQAVFAGRRESGGIDVREDGIEDARWFGPDAIPPDARFASNFDAVLTDS